VQVVVGDLDTPSSLEPHLARVSSIYCHALSGDAASADPAELARGQALAQLAGRYKDQLRLVVYNSSAGRGSNAGISQVGGWTGSHGVLGAVHVERLVLGKKAAPSAAPAAPQS
jgi:hypothetical protein